MKKSNSGYVIKEPPLPPNIKAKSFYKENGVLYEFRYYSISLSISILKPNSWGLYCIGLHLRFSSWRNDDCVYFVLHGFRDLEAYPADRKLIDLVVNTHDVDRIVEYAKSLIPPKIKKAVALPMPKPIAQAEYMQMDLFT